MGAAPAPAKSAVASRRLDFLEWTANPAGVSAAAHLRAFRSLVLAHVAVQAWAWALRPLEFPYTFPPLAIHACALVLSAGCLASLLPRPWVGRVACMLAVPLVAAEIAWSLPATANHGFLSWVLVLLCAVFDPDDPDEERLLLQGLRWIAVIIFFWAGLQKALHGLYFRGDFLSWATAVGGSRWVDLFAWVLPADEIARLRALPQDVGAGPFRMDSAWMGLLSNGVWVGEMAMGVAMLFRRTREIAALAAISLVWLIQAAPREFMFALLYTNLLLLFVRGEPNRRGRWVFLLAYALLVAAVAGTPGLEGLVKRSGL
jgi:hypothetical protein